MILGIGCDICDIRRIEKILNDSRDAFLQKVFCQSEIDRLSKRKLAIAGFAKVFAAKEAVVKALGITENISWQDIEVVKNTHGKPMVNLSGAADALATFLAKGEYIIHLSLSDDYPYAMAYVIFSKA
jgi:holo-[acyl-carrier protein] synthase